MPPSGPPPRSTQRMPRPQRHRGVPLSDLAATEGQGPPRAVVLLPLLRDAVTRGGEAPTLLRPERGTLPDSPAGVKERPGHRRVVEWRPPHHCQRSRTELEIHGQGRLPPRGPCSPKPPPPLAGSSTHRIRHLSTEAEAALPLAEDVQWEGDEAT
jgi:hypothetical protein